MPSRTPLPLPPPLPHRGPLILLPRHEVLRRTGRKNTWLWTTVKAGKFPQPVKIDPDNPQLTHFAWYEHEVDGWETLHARGAWAKAQTVRSMSSAAQRRPSG